MNPITIKTDNEKVLFALVGQFVKVSDETQSWSVIGEVGGVSHPDILIRTNFGQEGGIEVPLYDGIIIECLQETEV